MSDKEALMAYDEYMREKDDYDFGRLENDLNQAEKKISQLEADLKEAISALEVYADPENWNRDSDGFALDSDYDHFQFSDDEFDHGVLAGKRARETLEKLKRGKSE